MPKVKSGKGECQQVILQGKDADITKLPVITCWPKDGGPFVTLPIIHTKDPNTNIRNVGMYRMQVFGPQLTGMHWHKHKVSAKHFSEYKKLNKRMPVAVALGGDPVYAYSATAPLPENVDEFMLAGFLRKKKVELVKCITQPDIEVPADADFVIEGYVDPGDELIWEGPFGDHTVIILYPTGIRVFTSPALHTKQNPVYPATIVGIPPQEDAWLIKASERIFLAPMKMTMVPEIIDMDMPVEGVAHNLVIAQIKKRLCGAGTKSDECHVGCRANDVQQDPGAGRRACKDPGLPGAGAICIQEFESCYRCSFFPGTDGCTRPQLQQAWIWRKDVH
jgi:4-hydroxy-3-polyprenylbenzoate decarboxylase